MKVLMSGGGTAGHINPALAIADTIKKNFPLAEILFVGTPTGMESKLVPQAGFDYVSMPVSGFQRKMTLENVGRNLEAARHLLLSGVRSAKIIRDFKPDIAIGTGGYVCGPVLRKAAQMGVPVLVHEANAFPGMTVKMLARYCDCVMLAVEDAKERISADTEFVVTGNPVRAEVLEYDKARARRELELDERPLIVSFGGSLGARTINESMLDLLARSAKDGRYQHIHGYGKYGGFVLDELKKRGVRLKKCPNLDVREYISDMPRVMAAADLVICRSGAMALTEIQALGKAAILIPSPNVAENHQYYNAMSMVDRGAAEIIVEKEITPQLLMEKTDMLAGDRAKLEEMSKNAKNMAILDSRERIFNVVCSTLKKHGKL
ncbi:MAG: undecaprenyldiphospho-muramoylpentapeptide beta-N-acetylglucosaminyltransferase [Clostridia bacterium]|nr:undecaprenyldiphospho-muramoylpentapeptide beta-N-acetylglucosaminyltransferase [Clostridia bacterium]